MYIGLHVKYPLFFVSFYSNLNFIDIISKNTKISNFIKIHPLGVELFHVDGQTDMTKVIVAFRNFANAPKSNRDKGKNCGSSSTQVIFI
jgi:hypothetical protein